MKDFRHVIFILIILVFLLQMYVMKEDAKHNASDTNQTSLSSNYESNETVFLNGKR